MPAYLPKRNGVSLSEAYAEAATRAPITRVMLATYELRHVSFDAPIRIVNDYQNLDATLEVTAPENPGETVTFTALPVEVSGPDEKDTNEAPTIQVAIDGVSRQLAGQLDAAVQTFDLIYVTERIYASDDTTGPAVLPVLTLVLRDVEITEKRVTGQASFYDPTNRGFPRQEYTPDQYPGLSAR